MIELNLHPGAYDPEPRRLTEDLLLISAENEDVVVRCSIYKEPDGSTSFLIRYVGNKGWESFSLSPKDADSVAAMLLHFREESIKWNFEKSS